MLAVVGQQRCAIGLQPQPRLAAQFGKLTGDVRGGHGDDFNRQGKAPQHVHALALIGNADEAVALGGHDFFAREGRATALDHVALAVDLVGAVDVHGQRFDSIGFQHGNAQLAQTLGRCQRAAHGTAQAAFDGCQRIDEFIDGRAGAHADDAVWRHMAQSGCGHQGFEFVLCHAKKRITEPYER